MQKAHLEVMQSNHWHQIICDLLAHAEEKNQPCICRNRKDSVPIVVTAFGQTKCPSEAGH